MEAPRRSDRIKAILARKQLIESQQAAISSGDAQAAAIKPSRQKSVRARVGFGSQRQESVPASACPKSSGGAKRKRPGRESAGPRKKRKTQQTNEVEATNDLRHPQFATQATEPSPPPREDNRFLEVLVSLILAQRVLRQKRIEREECVTEQSQIQRLQDFTWPHLINVPAGDEYRAVHDDLRTKVQRYEKHLEQRQEREQRIVREIEELCLETDVDFQGALYRWQWTFGVLMDLELELKEIEMESEAAHDKIDRHASQVLAKGLKQTVAQSEITESDTSPQEDLSGVYGLLGRQAELQQDEKQTKRSLCRDQDVLVKLAERALVEAKILQPSGPDTEETEPTPVHQQQEANVDVESAEPGSQNIATINLAGADPQTELAAAQEQLRNARLEYEEGRKWNEDDVAKLPQPVSEDYVGVAMALKLSRATLAYIAAEERYHVAHQAARDAGVADRFPIDQTWNFEDRPDDGYAESLFAQRIDKVKPKVESWIPKLPTAGARTPPSSVQETPESMPDLDALNLGEDYMNGAPHATLRKRIDNHRKVCDELREKGPFPKASSDPPIIVDEEAETASLA